MAWETIVPAQGARGARSRVTVACRKVTGNGAPALAITLGGDLAKELGWVPKGRVQVQVDRSAGLLRLAPSTDPASFALYGKPGQPVVSCYVRLQGISEKQPARATEHRVEDGALIVTLPTWAQPTEAAKPPASPSSRPSPPLVKSPTPTRVSETAPTPAEEDEREAEAMVLAGRGARDIAEEFGWSLPKAQEFAAKVRRKAA